MEIKNIPVDQMDAEGKYPQAVPVVAEIVKIIRSTPTYTLVGLLDFAGQEICALINGRTIPQYADVGRIAVFKLAAKTGQKGVQYSGFYNPNDEIPAKYRDKKPPKPQEETKGYDKKAKTEQKGSSGNRSFALAYAKDCFVAGKVDYEGLKMLADQFDGWLSTGKWPQEKQQQLKKNDQAYDLRTLHQH